MKLSTPRWWYVRRGAPAPITRALLKPLSWLWAAATARRIARVTPQEAGVAVICVGNLTVGGAGKTPVARAILARLRRQGVEAHGLSRGHGGKLAGPLRVNPTLHSAADVGDEPLMLSQDAPAWISRDRPAGARAAKAAGAQVVVMDDGHQNPSLAKTLSLVVVDGETRDDEWPFGDGSVFPSGPMREPLKAGLARADAVILLLPFDMDAADPQLLAMFGATPVLIARLAPAAAPPSGPQLAFAGIGKPWKFERSLKAAGATLIDFAAFADHQAYDEGTLKALERRAADDHAGLLTTEKDWARLSPAWRAKITAWPVAAVFEDEAGLDAVLAAAIS
jgi:tetraacyldisaccharide 4'-kinase